MSFTETLTYLIGLLYIEKRVSYRRLRKELQLDDDTLETLRDELIVKQLAQDDDGQGLVFIGSGDTPWLKAASSSGSLSAEEPTTNSRAPASALVRQPRTELAKKSANGSSGNSDAERRQLTVMFCDLVGSTALSTQMDPEDLRDVITSFQDKCREAIQRYGGFIARYMGDGMLVYFGYPQAHEDDVERAARAGLDVVAAVTGLNAEVGTPHGVFLAVRVGIATGPVIVGDFVGEGAAEEAAVVGETPNLAARLQGAAQPNQVAVGGATKRMLGDRFEFADLGTHELKGMAEPVQVWRVSGERDIGSRFAENRATSATPLVGRQEEMGLLLRAWEGAREGRGQMMLIQGEAGVGKSRLIETLREQAKEQEHTWIGVRPSPYHTGSPLYSVIEQVRRGIGWEDEDSDEAKLDKLERAMNNQTEFSAEEQVPLFASLLSLPLPENRYPSLNLSPKAKRDATLDAISGWALGLTEHRPVLMVWEDLHWADPTTVELVGLMLEQVPTVPMLMVGTYRPEFVPPWPTRTHLTPITLSRLERSEVEAIATNLVGGKALPAPVLEHIVAKADGVPLYVEELTKAILASEILKEDTQSYSLTGSLADMHIPETLQDALMARLDRVPMIRELAQLGAVIGREFAYEMLNQLTSQDESATQEGLAHLVGGELLYQRGRGHRARYIFKHALIQDTAYQSLLKRTRQQYHEQVARLLETRYPEALNTEPEIVAHHFTEAGNHQQAINYWQRAGQRATEVSANEEVIAHLTTGLGLFDHLPSTPDLTQLELEMQMMLGPALMAIQGFGHPEVERTYARARELCQQIGDAPELGRVMYGLYRFYRARGELRKAREVGDQLLTLAQDIKDPFLLLTAHQGLGGIFFYLGEFASARMHLEQGIAHHEQRKHRSRDLRFGQDPGALCLQTLARTLWILGYPDQAIQRSHEALTLAQELALNASQAAAMYGLARLLQLCGDVHETRVQAEAAMNFSAEQGIAQEQATASILHGWALTRQGQGEDGITQMRQGLAANQAAGNDVIVPTYLALLAEALGAAGQTEQGLPLLAEAQGLSAKSGQRYYDAEFLRIEGELLLQQTGPDAVQAEACFHKALDIARQQEARALELQAATSLARLWRSQGKRQEAHDLLAPVYNWFTEGFDTADLKEARLLLDEFEALGSDVVAH